MTSTEFDNQFDVLYNNITSNQAPGINTFEKCVFLTKAQDEKVKNNFLPQSNPKQAGFDDNQKRQADFSCLMKTANCTEITSNIRVSKKYTCSGVNLPTVILYGDAITFNPTNIDNGTYTIENGSLRVEDPESDIGRNYTVTGFPYESGTIVIEDESTVLYESQIDDRSSVYTFPPDVFISINEVIKTNKGNRLQVIPLRYDEYLRLMSRPYKRPLKNQAWRLISTGDSSYNKYVELITGPNESITAYTIRYIRKPKPIIIGSLDGLTIEGYCHTSDKASGGAFENDATKLGIDGCELDPMLHEEILQRAVELAKIAWTGTGQDNTEAVLAAGQRSE